MGTQLLELALTATSEASAHLLERFSAEDLLVREKGSAADVVTDADLTSERLIRDRVLGQRPHDAFLGEEGGESYGVSGVTWVVDPLDSTANYARGIPLWSVSVAARDAERLVAGVVACPPLREVFAATQPGTATCNGRPLGRDRRSRSMDGAMVAVGWGRRTGGRRQGAVAEALIPRVGKVRSPGSPAMGLAWTAAGRFDAAFYEMDFSEWDIAAGTLLCQSAGLKVTLVEASSSDRSPRLLAAAAPLHDALAELLLTEDDIA